MTIPLGVLAVGSVLAGMVWYGSFFGDHNQVNTFFGIAAHTEAEGDPAAAAEADHSAEAPPKATSPSQARGLPPIPSRKPRPMRPTRQRQAKPPPPRRRMPHPATRRRARSSWRRQPRDDDAHHAPVWVKVSPFVAMLIGFVTAWIFYIRDPSIPGRLAAQQPILYRFLLNKWYFDEVYDFLFVRSAKALGRFLWKRGDGNVIDGSINGVAMGSCPSSPASRAGPSPATSSTMPLRWSSALPSFLPG